MNNVFVEKETKEVRGANLIELEEELDHLSAFGWRTVWGILNEGIYIFSLVRLKQGNFSGSARVR